jgi:hypothetical protein
LRLYQARAIAQYKSALSHVLAVVIVLFAMWAVVTGGPGRDDHTRQVDRVDVHVFAGLQA